MLSGAAVSAWSVDVLLKKSEKLNDRWELAILEPPRSPSSPKIPRILCGLCV